VIDFPFNGLGTRSVIAATRGRHKHRKQTNNRKQHSHLMFLTDRNSLALATSVTNTSSRQLPKVLRVHNAVPVNDNRAEFHAST